MNEGDGCMNKFFDMYVGLKKDCYILAFGRAVTSMGSLIWPMLTLILKSKLGYGAETIAQIFLIMGIVQLPMNLLGGKLADCFSKKHLIVIFDIISILCFIITGLLPLSMASLCIYFIGSIFQQMESPSYDALVADLTTSDQREKAYSLNYLAMNFGIVLSPIIGGLLFKDYLNLAFIISGISISFSTILIFFFIHPVNQIKEQTNSIYESEFAGSAFSFLKARKILLFYFIISALGAVIYSQFNFLMPLHLEAIFFEDSAFYFGILTSINAFVVVTCTPLLTKWMQGLMDISKNMIGFIFEVGALSCFMSITNQYFVICILMVFFTFGEISMTLGNIPYVTRRIPSTHRGRIIALVGIFTSLFTSFSNLIVGKLVEMYSLAFVWRGIALFGLISVILFVFYMRLDRKSFPLLYEKSKSTKE